MKKVANANNSRLGKSWLFPHSDAAGPRRGNFGDPGEAVGSKVDDCVGSNVVGCDTDAL